MLLLAEFKCFNMTKRTTLHAHNVIPCLLFCTSMKYLLKKKHTASILVVFVLLVHEKYRYPIIQELQAKNYYHKILNIAMQIFLL